MKIQRFLSSKKVRKLLILVFVGVLTSLILIFTWKINSTANLNLENKSSFSTERNLNQYPQKSDIKNPHIKPKNDDFLIPKDHNEIKNFYDKPKKYNLSESFKNDLKSILLKFQKIQSESKNLPISGDLLFLINEKINQANQVLTGNIYFNQIDPHWNLFFENYNTWKQAFLNKNEFVVSKEAKEKWNKIFNEESSNIYKLSFNNKKIELENYLKDFYIELLKEQINLYEQYPYYLQPLERLKKLLYYYQNHYEEYIDFQWGIDKDNKFSLEPKKYYSGNYQRIFINDEYIKNWLKYYQRWNWIFVKPENQIPKIEDKNIEALQINEKFKNNKIISDYIKRQINFTPDNYYELWTINPEHPEKVNYKNFEKHDFSDYFSKYENTEIQTIDEINKLNLKFNNFQTQLNNETKKIKNRNKEYEFFDNSQQKNFDYEKFWKYQNFLELKDKDIYGSVPIFKIYNNLLWDKPNLFSDGNYKSIYSELIKPVHKRKKEYINIIDYTTSLTDEEIKQGKKPNKDTNWINPILEYKKWFNHWKEVLPKIINKNWETKTKIKAVAYYIAANSLYLSPEEKNFNYNGYGFYNPTQIFTNDPEIQCVGYSMNLAAALTILNIPVRILGGPIVIDASRATPNGYHAWNEVFVDGRWKAINLTWFDYDENSYIPKTFELKDDKDLFLERNSEHMNQFRLDLGSYETTLMYFKNPKEYEYKNLPDNI
ncbi:transglutaminase-like domain-containing protein [Mycoplasmopsis citelli]|uniref:transglutaminase-like domain-containing protein n=1 Tax=Mycoplasmopsis citelli TaxID=171281 RepID=UPI002113E260|nr:transglutaminase-like domain-containing protein [Mycoplasmopsis citelli]UUD36104.1 transglutaminase-like domain-containing protein [Mycoplasmopsis citelli]